MLSFQNPRVNDTRWSFNTDAQSTNREYSTFDRNQQSAGFGGGYPLWFLGPEYLEDVRFYTEYEFARIKIDNVEEKAPFLIREQQGTTTVSSVTPKLVRNTIDNPLDPKKGSRQQLSVELAGLGGEEKFWLGQAANTLYYPLWESPIGTFVFSQRTRLGYGATYDNEDFPVIRRFFPGGINSVRGYKARKMGPKDENNEVYGGDKELIANFEVIFPLFQAMGLNGVVFYDAGDAFDDGDAIEVSKLRQAVGGGFRWRSPLAPIRIEFGFPLDKEEGDTGFVTNFTFGTPQ
jgi:outer membrane protein insertion porin family